MLASLLRSRRLWSTFALVAAVAVLVVGLLWRLSLGPIPLAFLDRPIADAIGALAPDLTAEVGATALARSGRGVALRVSGVRLLRHDGTPVLSLPALAIRPGVWALLAGRIEIARVDVADAELVLTRRPDGVWFLGEDEGGAGVAVLDLFGSQAAEERRERGRVPRIGLTRTHLTVDDQRAEGKLELANGELLVSSQPGRLEMTLRADLSLESASPAVRGVVRLPIHGEASVMLAEQGRPAEVEFTLAGDAGQLELAEDTGPPFVLAGLVAAGSYRADVATLRFERLAAVVGSSRLDATATVRLGDAPGLALDGTLDALPVTVLTRFWPADLAPAARSWLVRSVREGDLRRCRVEFGAPPASAPTPTAAAPASKTKGSAPAGTVPLAADAPPVFGIACDFAGVTANYLPPLDAIRAASGSARLSGDRLMVTVKAGAIGGCQVDGGTFVMNFAVDPPRAEITADLSGDGAAMLALVDRPPLQLVAPLGITPKDLGGQSRVHAELRLPIKAGLTAPEVGVMATAVLTQASLPPLIGGVGIKDGELEVRIDGRTFEVTGKIGLAGISAVASPVTIGLRVAPDRGGQQQHVTLALENDELVARGTASLAGNVLTALTVERLRLGGSDLAGTLRRRPNGDYEATLTGARLDLESLLADPPLVWKDSAGAGVGYSVAVRLDSVHHSRDVEIRNLHGSVQAAGGKLAGLALAGSLAPKGDFQLTLAGSLAGRRITLTADQAGRMLQAFGGLEQFVGGSLTLDAVTDQRGPQEFLEGKLVLRDFKVVRAPILAKILGLGSLGGIAALVQGEGLPVRKARFPFRWEADRLQVRDGRAIGAVGLTVDGLIDRRAGTCDVRGNIIPAYTLNSALGKIPLLGRLLVGGKGQGVFGIDYRVTGKTSDPTVRVNPLTSIAPTVLRSWFIDPFTSDPDSGP